MHTTIGQLLVNDALPDDLRDHDRVLDKAGIGDLLAQVAEKYPDQYREVAKRLSDVGHEAAFTTGGYSFGLKSLRTTLAARKMRMELGAKLRTLYANRGLTEDDRDNQVVGLAGQHQKQLMDAVFEEAKGQHHPLAMQAVSGARGNKVNVNSLLGADMLYVDHHDRPIPIPVLRSYAQGLRPVEYFAGAFGARKGVMDLKCCDADTPVLMADFSVRAIKDVRAGDWVMGAARDGRLSPTRVVRVYDNGWRECITATFRVGSCRNRFVTVTATEDHKVLAQVKAGRPGSTYAYRSVYIPTPLPLSAAKVQKNVTKTEYVAYPGQGGNELGWVAEPKALLYGLLIGDGNIPATQSVTLSCADPRLIEDIQDYVTELGLALTPPKADTAYVNHSYIVREIQRPRMRSVRTTKGNHRFAGTTSWFKQWLHQIGLAGKLSPQKTLSPEIWQWDDESVGRLLAGLYSTDGTIEVCDDHCNIKFKLTAESVVRDVQRLLELRFGVWSSSLRRIPKEQIPLGNYDQFEFVITHAVAIRRFAAVVRLVGKKRQQLELGLLRSQLRPRNSEIGFKIVSKLPVGLRRTYDLEVEHPDHLFVLANGLVVSNSATRDAGFLAKQLAQVSHRLLVSSQDDDNPYDDTNPRGMPSDTLDPDNEGALLAHAAGGYPRDTELTPKILKDLHGRGLKQILVRSPIVGGPEDGGVYARDVGRRERGGLPPIGDMVGIAAAQALSEPITQASISSKHSGGIAGASAGAIGGFQAINSLIQVPKTFRNGAAHAQLDGRVSEIREAPQGGHYVRVGSKEHYVPHSLAVTVKAGDEIEAGDVLSEGVPNPAEIVRHKGVGAGRRYFVDAFRKTLKDSGVYGHRRNIELLGRGLINHVRLTDELDDWAPDDVVPYQTLERNWQPRVGTETLSPASAMGRYLERPTLHHSIGTKIRPSMLQQFSDHGVKQLAVHPEPPPFEPEMIRGMSAASHDPDWMARMIGSYQSHSLLSAAHRGAVSDEHGSSYVPALSHGKDYGKVGLTKGWRTAATPQPP